MQSHLRRPTCIKPFVQSQLRKVLLRRVSCAEPFTQSEVAQSYLHRAICAELLAQSNLHSATCAELEASSLGIAWEGSLAKELGRERSGSWARITMCAVPARPSVGIGAMNVKKLFPAC